MQKTGKTMSVKEYLGYCVNTYKWTKSGQKSYRTLNN